VVELSEAEGWSCPVPLRDHDRVVLGHGGGGRLSNELVEHLFLPALAAATTEAGSELADAAEVMAGSSRLAFSTDSYVVRPLVFPGGSIGDLAINGTINDVAMRGARPIAISAGFILVEGLELGVLGRVANDMGAAAAAAGVPVVTGDTKVVERGAGDGLYINTAGIGLIDPGIDIRPGRATPGDHIVVSGPIGLHGIAVLSQREGLEFGTGLVSDSTPLHGLVGTMIAVAPDLHVLRDPTRGGLAATLTEIAGAAGVGVEYEERLVPVPDEVAAACSFLGLDPLHVANEGKLVAFVADGDVDVVMEAMRAHPAGSEAAVIGRVVDDHPGTVVARTALGARRVVDAPLGEQLPRIC
jgi:hydrogenase expression/formation protein HypE